MSSYNRRFGAYLRSLRKVRGLTQDVLAIRSGLASDTIRRLESGKFSGSIDTLRKLAYGMDLSLATVFDGFEIGACDVRREIADLLACRPEHQLRAGLRVLRLVLEEVDALDGRGHG